MQGEVIFRSLHLVVLAVTLMSLASVDLASPPFALAKEFDVVGTVDCGSRSGRRCSLDDVLVLLTDSVTGVNERLPIDMRWIKRKLPALDQDDEITLSVELMPDGTLKALSVVSAKHREGAINQGLSTDSAEVTESRRDRGLEQDKDSNPVQQAGGGVAGIEVNWLTGVVRSLITNAPIQGATVVVNGVSTTTDANGAYAFSRIDPGTYQVAASASGFISQTLSVTIQAGVAAQLNFDLATALPGLNFTLTWGTQPQDLDAHLSGPASTPPSRFHAYFQNQDPEVYVTFLDDVQSGLGPERITVRPHPSTSQVVAGDYHFWGDNPNVGPAPNYTGSQARVVVTRDSVLIGVFDVTSATGDPNARLWHVVNVQIDAAGNTTFQPVQIFTNGTNPPGPPATVLAPPYGGKPSRR